MTEKFDKSKIESMKIIAMKNVDWKDRQTAINMLGKIGFPSYDALTEIAHRNWDWADRELALKWLNKIIDDSKK